MIPRTIHQVWSGNDTIPERLAIYMAQNSAYCIENGFEHNFWRLIDDNKILLRYRPDQYALRKLSDVFEDDRIMEMVSDPKIHRVMKSDIIRFNLLYKFGGFYADLDLLVLASLEKYLDLDFVCGFEKPRPVVCTAFMASPAGLPINKAVSDFILSKYEQIKRENKYPRNLWDVLVFTGPDMLTDILKAFPEVKPFPPETFFPLPIPNAVRPFTVHYFAGAKKGGWTFDGCADQECSTCKDRPKCNIVKEKI
jgi:mannosyltransferase OCH1-like enzyme